MAFIRKDLKDIRTHRPRVDRARMDATTEDDIRRHRDEDRERDTADGFEPDVLPQAVRKKLGMTQEQFAAALRVPLATLRNWEQGRVRPDPAARSLLLIVYKTPETALAALAA